MSTPGSCLSVVTIHGLLGALHGESGLNHKKEWEYGIDKMAQGVE